MTPKTAFRLILAFVAILLANPLAAEERLWVEEIPVTGTPSRPTETVPKIATDVPSSTSYKPTLSLDQFGPPDPFASRVAPESRTTVVALNYCRASLHRIRSYPTSDVLAEERERILDNISLTGIADAEVIRLYSALLEEIGSIPLRDAEKQLSRSNHNRAISRQVTWDVLAFSTQLATAQFGSAIKTGADSWWDVRDRAYRRESDQLKLDRSEMQAVVAKSTLFLDTFWKLARKRDIPDAWLVRGADLDRLAAVLTDPASSQDSAVRLRRLARLESFLAAYPPYWYHVARTQQELGLSAEAVRTYEKLEALETGHFRVDEMLAASLANMALLQDDLGDPRAAQTAARALAAAPAVPEANLAAARVLQRGGHVAIAEEALFRNIDNGLAVATSQTFRLGLYYHAGDRERLLAALDDEAVLQTASAAAVLKCLTRFEPHEYPQTVIAELSRSLAAYPRVTFGADELVVAADHRWRLPQVGWQLPVLQSGPAQPQLASIRGGTSARFAAGFDWGHPLNRSDPKDVELVLTYPDSTQVALTLSPSAATNARGTFPPLVLSKVRVEGVQISFDGTPVRAAALIGDEFAIE